MFLQFSSTRLCRWPSGGKSWNESKKTEGTPLRDWDFISHQPEIICYWRWNVIDWRLAKATRKNSPHYPASVANSVQYYSPCGEAISELLHSAGQQAWINALPKGTTEQHWNSNLGPTDYESHAKSMAIPLHVAHTRLGFEFTWQMINCEVGIIGIL